MERRYVAARKKILTRLAYSQRDDRRFRDSWATDC